ncbi:MAG: hypothetical protein HF973_06250 [Chloroflexi bacterium]|nr:hypothetical protein [Chloroflexota bacterium]
MSDQSAIDMLVEALTAVPEYDNPLNPIYDVLGRERPLTLRAIRQQTQLLHDHADQAQDQTFAVNRVIISCKQIPPTPLSAIPLGF